MKKKRSLKPEIERYLKMPIRMLWIIVLVTIIVLCLDIRAGIIFTCATGAYILIVFLVYIHYRPMFSADMISFAIEHSQIQKELLKELAVPYVLLDMNGSIMWYNQGFDDICERKVVVGRNIKQYFSNITPDMFPTIYNKTDEFSMEANERKYRVEFRTIHMEMPEGSNFNLAENEDEMLAKEPVEHKKKHGKKKQSDQKQRQSENSLVALYFFDETQLQAYMKRNREEKLVAGLIYIDNYDEVMEKIEEVRQSLLMTLVDRKINKYMHDVGAIIKKSEKDKYLVVFKQKYLSQLQSTKFSLLDEVREINIGNEMAVTLSISLGVNGDEYQQCYEDARIAMDMALARGGDQVVIKDGEKITYYGGKTHIVEKSTRVKARVKAHALQGIVETKEKVVIMGHHLPDVDSLGSALGIYIMAKNMGKKAHIVINEETISIRPVIEIFKHNPLYEEDMFIDNATACETVNEDTLLMVVDVNRPSYTECPKLLELTKTVVVFDHHRQTSEIINNAVLSYVEPYASSACEMVAEVLQYAPERITLKPAEADAMYAGILVDTDNFVQKTGVRTFEAAAYLRRNGADVVRVRKMFRDGMDEYKLRAEAVRTAEVFMGCYAMAIFPSGKVDSPTVLASQVANELLDIKGIGASFVVTKVEEKIYISARSIDSVNVQLIMEEFDGGGHANAAGAQLSDCSEKEALNKIKEKLKEMTKEGVL